MGALGNFGRSQARRVDPETIRVTFKDVAGIDEAKAELSEIVDFLRNPERYGRLGGRMPHGVLLSGAPGTGKTLLARAVAGEAHAAFFSISASEFIEAIVGVGASRVRDLFAKAKEAAPAIIFIDELDAIGRSRQGSVVGHRRQRRARADARPDPHRDGRLRELRGGRRAGRHEPARRARLGAAATRAASTAASPCRPPTAPAGAKSSKCTRARSRSPTSVDLDALAASTPGMVGADLANLANEAALLAARRGHEEVRDGRLHRLAGEDHARLAARDRAVPRRPRAHRLPRVRPRARRDAHAGRRPGPQGLDHPARDGARRDALDARRRPRLLFAARTCRRRSEVALGGRVAEEVVYGTITTGAESDIQQLTADRAPDGRALGHERGDRPDRRAARRRRGTVPAGRERDLRVDPAARRRGGAQARRRARTRRSRSCSPSIASSSRASRRRC